MQFPGGKARDLEDLKARYYSIARQLAIYREVQILNLQRAGYCSVHGLCEIELSSFNASHQSREGIASFGIPTRQGSIT